jgi:hypothetical protein
MLAVHEICDGFDRCVLGAGRTGFALVLHSLHISVNCHDSCTCFTLQCHEVSYLLSANILLRETRLKPPSGWPGTRGNAWDRSCSPTNPVI